MAALIADAVMMRHPMSLGTIKRYFVAPTAYSSPLSLNNGTMLLLLAGPWKKNKQGSVSGIQFVSNMVLNR